MRVFVGAAVVMFLFLVAIIVSFVLYSLLLCNICQSDLTKRRYCTAALVLWVVFAILFIVFLVFLGINQHNYKKVMCSIFKLPAASIEGY